MKRNAFTLVELLVVITIIAILAAVFLGAMFSAQESSRDRKTRSTIVKINTIIADKMDSYRTRRIALTIPPDEPYTDINGNGTRDSSEPYTDTNGNGKWDYSLKARATARLNAIRKLMQWEMPDRFNEIPGLTVVDYTPYPGCTLPRPAVSLAYKRKIGTPSSNQFASAETLFLIVMSGFDSEESPAEMFREGEIGDKDGDGLREFWDGWQNPISWVRWPAGANTELIVQDPVRHHDPFDSRQVHTGAYALYPVIYSPGPDGKYEVNNDADYIYVENSSGILDPYVATPPKKIGEWTDTDGDGVNDTVDNIHSHALGAR